MKNVFKITILIVASLGNSFASTGTDHATTKKELPYFHLKIENDFSTDPKKNDPRNKTRINTKNEKDIIVEVEPSSYLAEQLVNVASDNIGTRYRSGGTTKDGYDCSGLMYATFQKFNFTLPRSSHEMALIGTKIELCDAKKGDLIFFSNRGQHRINHVGMIVEVKEDGEILFVHSSTSNGVIISSLKEAYHQRTFTQVNRIVE